jgi:hypothetical protein
MDEPMWFGHIVNRLAKTTGRGRQYSVPQVTDRAAAKIAVLRRYFPDIKLGDIEPVSARAPGGPPSIEDILTFETLLRQKTGDAPVFVHADPAGATPGWQPLLQALATRVHAGGIRFGVICDGDPRQGATRLGSTRPCSAAGKSPQIPGPGRTTSSPRPGSLCRLGCCPRPIRAP